MNEKRPYGETYTDSLYPGDIVEWRRWDTNLEKWTSHYGVIIEIKNQFLSNRLVSIANVLPIDNNEGEIELFSLSLRLVSRGTTQNENKMIEQ
jgi:hypothetical protein